MSSHNSNDQRAAGKNFFTVMYVLKVLEGVLFHLRKMQRSNWSQIFKAQGHCQEIGFERSVFLSSWIKHSQSRGHFVCASTATEKASPFHQTQFRTPRHGSALCIFCVKLYFQSFMSNLNSWQLHSDLDRIPNLLWTPYPFHNTRTHVHTHTQTHTHTCEHTHIQNGFVLTLALSQNQEFWMAASWLEL